MARAVLLEGASYIGAVRQHGGTWSTQAQQAVRVLLRYRHLVDAMPEVRSRKSWVPGAGPKYPGRLSLTAAEFAALIVRARQDPARGGKRLSARSIAMARAVLVEGATYREAERAQGLAYSAAARAVAALLRFQNEGVSADRDPPEPLHDPFGRIHLVKPRDWRQHAPRRDRAHLALMMLTFGAALGGWPRRHIGLASIAKPSSAGQHVVVASLLRLAR